MATGVVAGINLFGSEESSGPGAVDSILPEPNAPTFAAGAGCVTGTDSTGATISNSAPADTRGSGPAAIGGMEHAYYALRNGSAVASFMAPSIKPNSESIQAALDAYFPAGTNVTYCMKITSTADANVSDVQIIEARDGVEKVRVHQLITTERSSDGAYRVSKVVKVE